MRLSEVPGYCSAMGRAGRLETYWRDFAFFGIPEEIRIGETSVEIRLLTLRMFVQLAAVRSPFIVGGRVQPEHVVQILWRLSPEYDARDKNARIAFIERISALPFKPVVRAISRFLDRMLLDQPPTDDRPTGGSGKADTSFAASVVHILASTYGWSTDEILDTSLPILFQFIRKIQRDTNPDLEHFNPLTDRFTQRMVQKYFASRSTPAPPSTKCGPT